MSLSAVCPIDTNQLQQQMRSEGLKLTLNKKALDEAAMIDQVRNQKKRKRDSNEDFEYENMLSAKRTERHRRNPEVTLNTTLVSKAKGSKRRIIISSSSCLRSMGYWHFGMSLIVDA